MHLPTLFNLPNLILRSHKKDPDRFTGGDDLTGLSLIYHEVMMKNELYNGKGAYQLSFAGGQSGFSFGGNQMDMGQDKRYIELFVNILENASDTTGSKILSEQEIAEITGLNDVNLSQKGQTINEIFGTNIIKINQTLSSDYGKQIINEAYKIEIAEKSQEIDQIVESMQNPAAKAFYNTDLGKALLFDYNNQYGIENDSPFLKYIDSEGKIHYTTKEPQNAPKDHYTFANHEEYMLGTKQCHDNPNSCNNRLNNVLKVVTEQDKVWDDFTLPDFAAIYIQGKGWKIYPGAKLPPFEMPDPDAHGPNIATLADAIVPPEPLQSGMYYYFSDTQHLFQLNGPMQPSPPPAYPHDIAFNKWLHVSFFLIKHDIISNPQLTQQFESQGLYRSVDYDKYHLLVTKLPVKAADLQLWIGNALFKIIEPNKIVDHDESEIILSSEDEIGPQLPNPNQVDHSLTKTDKKSISDTLEVASDAASDSSESTVYSSLVIESALDLKLNDFSELTNLQHNVENGESQILNLLPKINEPIAFEDVISSSRSNHFSLTQFLNINDRVSFNEIEESNPLTSRSDPMLGDHSIQLASAISLLEKMVATQWHEVIIHE